MMAGAPAALAQLSWVRASRGARSAPPRCSLVVLLAMAAAIAQFGCASHSDRTKAARSALDAGRASEALSLYNKQLGVESKKELPAQVEGDNTLLLLDRAMILQSVEDYELSSRDLQAADKAIEVLDFSRSTADDIGKYLFSDDTGPYKAPFYEKLLINTVNIVNYLERGDLSGARVEARRLAVMQKFIADHEGNGASLMVPGSFLAGFVFEKSGQPQEALRYYDEALQVAPLDCIKQAVIRVAAQGSYRTPRIQKILDAAGASAEADDEAAELIVFVSNGRVPAKVPERVPIGLALTYASGILSPNDRARANKLAAQGLVTWVNYPKLEKPKKPAVARMTVDGKPHALELALAVDTEAVKAWDDVRGTLVASAIIRMIARVVAGETTKKVAGGGLAGTLLSLGTQATLAANDVPDTRSWATLPGQILVARLALPPGQHDVVLQAGNAKRTVKVDLKPKGWSVVNFTTLR